MAGNPPIELRAGDKLRAVYLRKKVATEEHIRITDNGLNIIRRKEHEKLV